MLTMITRRYAISGMAARIAFGSKADTAVIAHRGEHIGCPENTLPAIEQAIRLGCQWVEIDVRTTRDGRAVLMHDATVDRTTTGKGAVAEFEAAAIARLDASSGKAKFTGTPVPFLDEALDTMRGRTGVYLDAKRISAADIVAHLKRHGMLDHAVVYAGLPLLRDLERAGFGHLAMPEAESPMVLRRTLEEIHANVIAYDRRDFNAGTIAVARSAGKQIFVDRLGTDDNEAAWKEAIRLGASAIQTDKPAELIAMLLAGRQG